MRLVKRLIELAFFVFLLSLFGKNMDMTLQIKYYGLTEPIQVAFWELVIFCVSLGIIVAAVGDFITQLKWMGEKRRMIKTDREHASEVANLNDKIHTLEADKDRLERELEQKSEELAALKEKGTVLQSTESEQGGKSEGTSP